CVQIYISKLDLWVTWRKYLSARSAFPPDGWHYCSKCCFETRDVRGGHWDAAEPGDTSAPRCKFEVSPHCSSDSGLCREHAKLREHPQTIGFEIAGKLWKVSGPRLWRNWATEKLILPSRWTKLKARGEAEATEEEEELTAEERRKLERKLKKERKKKEKQLMREAGIPIKKAEPKKPSGCELALAYLTSWSETPEEWKFQKTRQTWLLLHMYDKEKVPDKYFTILLDYLQGLQGSARDITVQKAEAFMKEFDGSDAEDPNLLEKCERIRQVLQLLS
ncbi:protein cholesin, partial [Alca torda]